jgi:DNA-binding protein HU-beta
VNKRQLVHAAARRCDLTIPQMGQALEAILEAVSQALAGGDSVALSAFGRFEMQQYPARRLGRFGKPGQFTVEARAVPVFRSSVALRRRLREAADEE